MRNKINKPFIIHNYEDGYLLVQPLDTVTDEWFKKTYNELKDQWDFSDKDFRKDFYFELAKRTHTIISTTSFLPINED